MQSNKKQKQVTGITALYCRLSRDDNTDRDDYEPEESTVRLWQPRP